MANLSLPGNPRYQPKDLHSVFGYDNRLRRPETYTGAAATKAGAIARRAEAYLRSG
jgi:hypothetical protein